MATEVATTKTAEFTGRKVSNYRSAGKNLQKIDEFTIPEVQDILSKVLTNSNGTPYVWVNDGFQNEAAMAYMSTKGRDLAEKQQNQLSMSKHALQVWQSKSKDAAGAEIIEEFYVVTLAGEEITASEASYVA